MSSPGQESGTVCPLYQEQLEYVAWAQSFLGSFRNTAGLSALSIASSPWKMQIQQCASLALTSRLAAEVCLRYISRS